MKNFFIDISEHQKRNINWSRLKEQVDGVVVRVQYGSNYEDLTYRNNIANLKKHNIPFAVYAWVRGSSYNDMKTEARDFYNRAINAGATNDTWFFLDVEEQSMGDMRGGCENYRQQLKDLGVKNVGVYVAAHLYKGFNINVNNFDCLWVPTYGDNDAFHDEHTKEQLYNADIHQYSSTGRLDSIPGIDLDCNQCENGFKSEYIFGNERNEVNHQSSNKREWYTTKLKQITLKQDTPLFKDEALNEYVDTFKKGEVFNIVGDPRIDSHGHVAYQTESGLFVTGDKAYIDSNYYLLASYGGKKAVRLKSKQGLYKDLGFKELVREYDKGTVFNIVANEKSASGYPRLKTESGFYITSNKKYVEWI